MTADQYKERYEKENMWHLLMSMSLPMVAAQLVNLLYSVIDRVYIGHIPGVGTTALAGVSLCSTMIILAAAFATIVSGGGAPLASIAMGQGKEKDAGKILNTGFCLLVVFAAAITVLGLLFMTPFLRACGASDATLPYASAYMRIYLLGTIFVQLSLGLSAFVTAQGQSRYSFKAVTIGAVLNIVLDPVFIFTLNMGVRGAALATILSQAVSAALIVRFLTSARASLRLQKEKMHLDRNIVSRIFSLGVSPFVMASTEAVLGFVLNGQLARYGDIYVSALAIMQSGMQMISTPLQGFAQGSTPILSYNYGHGNARRLKECFRCMLIVCFTFNLAMTMWMVFCPRQIASVFTSDTELIDTVAQVMPYFMAGMSIFGLQRACQNTLVATNQAKVSLFIAFLRKIFLLIPLVYILQQVITPGYLGVYLAESIADATAAICCAIIFARRFPKILRSMPQTSAQ